MFSKFLNHLLEIRRGKELTEVIEFKNVIWSDFCQKWLDFSQILETFSGVIGQIVNQILEAFSQILMVSTLIYQSQRNLFQEVLCLFRSFSLCCV